MNLLDASELICLKMYHFNHLYHPSWWLSSKNPPAVRETWVPSLDREDPLEKEMATHSSILAWRIPWTEEPGV